MGDAYIVDAVRTPIARRNGALAAVHPGEVGADVLRSLVERNGFDPGGGQANVMIIERLG